MLGAAGGVGSALVELAQLDGVRVHGTASPRHHADLRARGVHVVADPAALTEPVDAIFDPVGGPSLARSRRARRRAGVVVAFGFSFSVGRRSFPSTAPPTPTGCSRTAGPPAGSSSSPTDRMRGSRGAERPAPLRGDGPADVVEVDRVGIEKPLQADTAQLGPA